MFRLECDGACTASHVAFCLLGWTSGEEIGGRGVELTDAGVRVLQLCWLLIVTSLYR